MITRALARRYASALADVVANQPTAAQVQNELSTWSDLMTANQELPQVFRNPTVPFEQKRNLLDALLQRTNIGLTTANFLKVLLQNHRLADLPEVSRAFSDEMNRRNGVVSAQITTARPVEETERASLQNQLQQMIGGRVLVDFAVDENLIGGVVTRLGSTVYDGSIRSQLDEIKDRLKGERV